MTHSANAKSDRTFPLVFPAHLGIEMLIALALLLVIVPLCVITRRGWMLIPILRLARRACSRTDLRTLVPLAGGLVAACLWNYGCSAAGTAAAFLVLTLLVLGWVDLRTLLLPDALTQPLLWVGLVAAGAGASRVDLAGAIQGAVVGYAVLWALSWICMRIRGVHGMANGDFKLLAAIGAWLGAIMLPYVLIFAAVVTLFIALTMGRGCLQPGAALPFGPGLASGGITLALAADQVLPVFGF